MTKQFFAITGLLLFSLTSFAQLSVTPYFQVDLGNFLHIPPKEMKVLYGINPTLGDHFKVNYSYGLDVTYDFTPKWSLKTGIMLQEMGHKSYKLHYFENDVFKGKQVTSSLKFITIPVQAQYNFRAKKRFSPYIAFGAALNINTQNTLQTTYFDANNNITDITNIPLTVSYAGSPQQFNISTKVDFGFNYKLTNHLSLNAFISNNALLRSAVSRIDDRFHYFNIGAGVGLKYSF